MVFLFVTFIFYVDISYAQILNDIYHVLLEKQLLETELELTKTNNLYFLFNFQEKKIQVRTKGIVLRDWEIESYHFWGNAMAVKTTTLIKKSSLFTPRRDNIKPGKKEEKKPGKAPGIQALELSDMPTVYTIFLEGNFRLHIRVKPGGFFPSLNYFRLSLKWLTYPPLFTLWYTVKAETFNAVDIVFKSKEDARALYWTFTEGCSAVILPPPDYFLPFPPTAPRRGGQAASFCL